MSLFLLAPRGKHPPANTEYVRSFRTLHVVLPFSAQYPNASAAYFFYALSELRFLNILVICYSKSCFFRFFESDNFRFQLSDTGYHFLLFVFVPEGPIFRAFILIHTTLCQGLEGSTKNRTGSPFPLPYLLFLALICPYFNTSGHSTFLCSFSPFHIVPHILSSPIILSFPQPFPHVLIPSIRPLLCSSQTIYQEWHPFPFYPSSFHHHLQHKTLEVERKRRVEGKNQKGGMKDLGGEKKSLISKALNPILLEVCIGCVLRDCVHHRYNITIPSNGH